MTLNKKYYSRRNNMSNMVINTTTQALDISRVGKNNTARERHVSAREFFGGQRVNSAQSYIIELAINEKIHEQIRGLEIANRNAQDGSSMAHTAENGARQIENLIWRVRELTIRSANDTNKESDRQKTAQEMSQLLEEVDRLAVRVEFNGKKLLEGSFSFPKTIYLQVGLSERQNMTFSIDKLNVEGLGLDTLRGTIKTAAMIDLNNPASLANSPWLSSGVTVASTLSVLDGALKIISHTRYELGMVQNRLKLTMTNLDISCENITASASRIINTGVAKEMVNMTKTGVLRQSSIAMPVRAYQSKRQFAFSGIHVQYINGAQQEK
jgi:flagellin